MKTLNRTFANLIVTVYFLEFFNNNIKMTIISVCRNRDVPIRLRAVP